MKKKTRKAAYPSCFVETASKIDSFARIILYWIGSNPPITSEGFGASPYPIRSNLPSKRQLCSSFSSLPSRPNPAHRKARNPRTKHFFLQAIWLRQIQEKQLMLKALSNHLDRVLQWMCASYLPVESAYNNIWMTKLWVLSVKESFHFVEIVPFFFFIIVSLIHSHVICPCGNCSCPKGEGGMHSVSSQSMKRS